MNCQNSQQLYTCVSGTTNDAYLDHSLLQRALVVFHY
jgi:hypothetical protein